ncbi:Uncharacterized HTH-type transcriptional regulator ydcR [Cedecea neteri]|uniref:Uncharacterized HTH-type transcriptional regulator ydcR n=1 Tax=Cedecea neteri TaxID=158822 RepID=A0A2X3J298_9ENTR|nr:Uncharacterized HTH-type transcriptional regulator ydcR [Cedecea neteri]
MKKYQQLAQQILDQIALGVWQPGDRLPSLREQVGHSGMSFMTVGHAYQMLESQGAIVARPQSGYYVAPRPVARTTPPAVQVTRAENRRYQYLYFSMSCRRALMPPWCRLAPRSRIHACFHFRPSTVQWRRSAKRPPPSA